MHFKTALSKNKLIHASKKWVPKINFNIALSKNAFQCVSRLLPQKTALTRVFFISASTSAVKIRLNKSLIMHD